MVKHTQTIRRQIADEWFVCDYFVELVFKRVEKCRASNILINRLPINPLSASVALA